MESWSIYLKRRRLARDYWMSVPTGRVNLTWFNFDRLTKTGLFQDCGTVGCVAGWIQTMPEFREWEDGRMPHKANSWKEMIAMLDLLKEWLGITEGECFGTRQKYDIPEWEEGLQRLDALVAEAEQKIKEECIK